ncbi:MAG: YhfG family protein [Pseudomonadota bacterium]|nr:YhfG family protein [Pseudomonadota bacterium]
MLSDDAKSAYVERTKAENYQASLRLEGFKNTDLPVVKSKQEVIDKYTKHLKILL